MATGTTSAGASRGYNYAYFGPRGYYRHSYHHDSATTTSDLASARPPAFRFAQVTLTFGLRLIRMPWRSRMVLTFSRVVYRTQVSRKASILGQLGSSRRRFL